MNIDSMKPWQKAGPVLENLQHATSFDAAMQHLDQLRELLLGPGHASINAVVQPRRADEWPITLHRIWSARASLNVVGGKKTKHRTDWSEHVLQQSRTFIGEGDETLALWFEDHEQLRAYGLRAIVNVPILQDGRCMAVYNVLSARPHWSQADLALIPMLACMSRSWVLEACRNVPRSSPEVQPLNTPPTFN